MAIISENTKATLKNKKWGNIAPNGFFITLYRDEMEFYRWESYCMEADNDIDPYEVNELTLLCVASTAE